MRKGRGGGGGGGGKRERERADQTRTPSHLGRASKVGRPSHQLPTARERQREREEASFLVWLGVRPLHLLTETSRYKPYCIPIRDSLQLSLLPQLYAAVRTSIA